MGLSTLGLEDKFESLANGSILTLKADIIILCPGATICKSVIYGQTFITDVKVDLSQQTASFINVRLERIGGKVWLLSTNDTITIQRPQLTLDGLANIVEACSGIGAVGQGFKTCGANTIAFCDYNAKFCEWLERRTDKPVIQGNIAHIKTVCQIDSAIGQQSHVLHGGVACQPFSKLGDEKQGNDIRSESFVGLLNAGYHLGSLMIIMECTPSAMTSQWGQEQLKKFTETTGYNVCQFVIDLSSCWPSKRQRWWVGSVDSSPFAVYRDPADAINQLGSHSLSFNAKDDGSNPWRIRAVDTRLVWTSTFPWCTRGNFTKCL